MFWNFAYQEYEIENNTRITPNSASMYKWLDQNLQSLLPPAPKNLRFECAGKPKRNQNFGHEQDLPDMRLPTVGAQT